MEETEHTIDLTLSAAAAVIPYEYEDFGDDKPEKPLRRRIAAVSEGKHNGTRFRADEIQNMVQDSRTIKEREGRSYYPAPVILDHSYRFIDKVGGTSDLSYGSVTVNGEKTPAAIADIEFWRDTPMQKEVASRVERDPENTYFSVRIRGMLHYDHDNDEYFWTDLRLIHIAVVNEPADGNARILEELSTKTDIDFSLYADSENPSGMEPTADLSQRLATLEQSVGKIVSHLEKQEADHTARQQAAAQENLMERATILADIFRLDPDVDRTFVRDLSREQLDRYKADLERRLPAETTEKGRADHSDGGQTTEDLARKLLEG